MRLQKIIFALVFFWPVYAQLEYSLGSEKKEILERDFERLCRLDFDAEFEFGDKEKWESVLKRAFGMERIDCLAFKKFIEDRVGLVVDHFRMENIVTINSDGVVERKEDWNPFFDVSVEVITDSLYRYVLENPRESDFIAAHLTGGLSQVLNTPPHERILFLLGVLRTGLFHVLVAPRIPGEWILLSLSSGLRRQNYTFALEYTTNTGEKNISPILFKKGVRGVVFLEDSNFLDPYSSFNKIGTLIHEARHESREFSHVPCLNDSEEICDNVPDGPFGLDALFLAYIAGICGSDCSEREKYFLILFALENFKRINLYYGDDGRKINPVLQRQLQDRQLSLDVYNLIVSLEEEKTRRNEDFENNQINWDDIIKVIEENEHPQ